MGRQCWQEELYHQEQKQEQKQKQDEGRNGTGDLRECETGETGNLNDSLMSGLGLGSRRTSGKWRNHCSIDCEYQQRWKAPSIAS